MNHGLSDKEVQEYALMFAQLADMRMCVWLIRLHWTLNEQSEDGTFR